MTSPLIEHTTRSGVGPGLEECEGIQHDSDDRGRIQR